MRGVNIVISAGWILFWIYWLVTAASAKSSQTKGSRGFGIRVGVVVVVLLLTRTPIFKGQTETVTDPLLQGLGLLVFVLGLGLAIWARIYLGGNWGMPMSRKTNPELVTAGPYRHVRHPIYSGIILAMLGTAIAVSAYWLVAAVVFSVYFIYSAMVEERGMAYAFPTDYPAYKQTTKMLIPFLL